MRAGSIRWLLASASALCLLSGCLSEYTSGIDYTDEDAGAGYEVDLAGEDLSTGLVAPGHFHPTGYAAPDVHGRDLKLQVRDCRTCHGENLTGGVVGAGGGTIAPASCDSCHRTTWRTDCTFCHGTKSAGGLGAPPRDLNGETDPTKISFPGHKAHLAGRIAPIADCIECHRKPTDILTPYHVFDASPRRGENNLSAGLSAEGVYDPIVKQCTNAYCHGNGRTGGTVQANASGLSCAGCHPDMTTSTRWNTMSGDHGSHLRDNSTCSDCHAATVTANSAAILDVTKHVNGTREVVFASGIGTITYDPATRRCTGSCHGEQHSNDSW